jgi:hypothetical protein
MINSTTNAKLLFNQMTWLIKVDAVVDDKYDECRPVVQRYKPMTGCFLQSDVVEPELSLGGNSPHHIDK